MCSRRLWSQRRRRQRWNNVCRPNDALILFNVSHRQCPWCVTLVCSSQRRRMMDMWLQQNTTVYNYTWCLSTWMTPSTTGWDGHEESDSSSHSSVFWPVSFLIRNRWNRMSSECLQCSSRQGLHTFTSIPSLLGIMSWINSHPIKSQYAHARHYGMDDMIINAVLHRLVLSLRWNGITVTIP